MCGGAGDAIHPSIKTSIRSGLVRQRETESVTTSLSNSAYGLDVDQTRLRPERVEVAFRGGCDVDHVHVPWPPVWNAVTKLCKGIDSGKRALLARVMR